MIIGLIGYAQSGKDTAAKGLTEFKRVAFADALKEDLAPLIARVGENLSNSETKIKARELLVSYGKVMRKFRPDFWIDRVKNKLDDGNIVITDVRYLNECKMILEKGGKLFMIARPGYPPANREERESFKEIMSSPALSYQVIDNDGSIEQLQKTLRKAINHE